ncbi:hypothetical protein NDU88_012416 [Pleurodeles waltl]|uniref:Uncharacterized protein n=1 Tax=Pleurodeles waltl TaxID=8319 RepID=A0AAV7R4J7_PLEWA|nr:hypothetical protein NDU88_012416 [Pleurodeles waltl]
MAVERSFSGAWGGSGAAAVMSGDQVQEFLGGVMEACGGSRGLPGGASAMKSLIVTLAWCVSLHGGSEWLQHTAGIVRENTGSDGQGRASIMQEWRRGKEQRSGRGGAGTGQAQGQGSMQRLGVMQGLGVTEGQGLAQGQGAMQGQTVTQGPGATQGQGAAQGQGEVHGRCRDKE